MNVPRRRGVAVLAVSGLFATAMITGMTSAHGRTQDGHHLARPNGALQQTATLLRGLEAFSAPNPGSTPRQFLAAHRPLTGTRTVLPVLATRSASGKRRWLEVMLPGRPNSRTGWIVADGTTKSFTSWSIIVDTSTMMMKVDQYGKAVRTVKVVVGKASTPTPIGRFFVEEVVELASNAVGSPDAFALSARSNVYQKFDGGPGQIAIHGLGNIVGVPGTAVSHGCVRVDAKTLSWMVARVGPGVPVTISR